MSRRVRSPKARENSHKLLEALGLASIMAIAVTVCAVTLRASPVPAETRAELRSRVCELGAGFGCPDRDPASAGGSGRDGGGDASPAGCTGRDGLFGGLVD